MRDTKKGNPGSLLLHIGFLVCAVLVGTAHAQVCTNGSAVDCNPAGATLNPAAAFVDPSPPAGYTQCAGFINTPADDVRWDWENNCGPLVDAQGNGLFMRVYDDNTGALIAGARLYAGIPLGWNPTTGYNFSADLQEGEGFLDNPNADDDLPGGTSLAFHQSNTTFCSCSRPPGGSGTCNDIFTASAVDDKIFYVGGNSSNHNYEAVWGPPGPKNTCSLSNEIVALRVAIYAGQSAEAIPGRFLVTKTFSDGIDAEVEVTLTCNSGLPLQQSFTIAGGDSGVNFVVEELSPGTTCEVTESGGPAGYTPIFNGGQGCTWVTSGGQHFCDITNQADPATFTVYKEWEIFNDGGDAVIEEAYVTIHCDSEILNNGLSDKLLENGNGFHDSISAYLGDGDSLVATVDTTEGPATCWAEESLDQSGVESSDDCGRRQIAAGGFSECTFVNTVFFEGIPTLSQYGLAVLALLMLGVGFAGFRRYV